MATKTIRLTEGAYARLHALKREGESFSDVVDRLTGKFVLLELVGTIDGKTAQRLRTTMREFGKRLRVGRVRAAGNPRKHGRVEGGLRTP